MHDDNFPRGTDLVIQPLENLPALRKPARPEDLSLRQGRQRSWKRLLWKVPVIFLLVSFAAWWQWRQEQMSQPANETNPEAVNRMGKSVSGIWQGEVTYGWGARYQERFFLQVEGDKLFGTASFLGLKRGIESGKIGADRASFSLRYQEDSGSTSRQVMNYYTIRAAEGYLAVTMRDSRGPKPLEFTLAKIREAG